MKTLASTGVVVLIVAFAAAGCGGKMHAAPPTTPPKLPRALAQSWAQQADAIAAALAAGDGCTAKTHAIALRTEIIQAASERRVAPRLAARIVGPANDLPERITCTPPAAPKPEHGPDHEHKHKDHHGKHGGEGD